MQMQVINHLSALAPDVKNKFIASEISFGGEVLGRVNDSCQDFIVIGFKMGNGLNMFFGYNQNMKRGFGVYVVKSRDFVVFKDRRRRQLVLRYFAENTVHAAEFSVRARLPFEFALKRFNEFCLGDALLNAARHLAENYHIIEGFFLAENQSKVCAHPVSNL